MPKRTFTPEQIVAKLRQIEVLVSQGKTIPQAASVSGHRSWQNLKRYAHLRQTGDKYSEWKWREP